MNVAVFVGITLSFPLILYFSTWLKLIGETSVRTVRHGNSYALCGIKGP